MDNAYFRCQVDSEYASPPKISTKSIHGSTKWDLSLETELRLAKTEHRIASLESGYNLPRARYGALYVELAAARVVRDPRQSRTTADRDECDKCDDSGEQ